MCPTTLSLWLIVVCGTWKNLLRGPGALLVQSVERRTLDLGMVSLSPTLGGRVYLKTFFLKEEATKA